MPTRAWSEIEAQGAPEAKVVAPAPVEVAAFWTRRKVAVASGGVGLLGVGLGVTFGLLASSDWSAARSAVTAQAACPSAAACPAHTTAVNDRASAEASADASDIAIGVGAALVVTGVVVWLAAPATSSAPGTARLRVLPGVVPAGGTLTMLGVF